MAGSFCHAIPCSTSRNLGKAVHPSSSETVTSDRRVQGRVPRRESLELDLGLEPDYELAIQG